MTRRETVNNIIIQALSPLAGLIYSLFNWRKPWARAMFWVSCVFMSLIQIYQVRGFQLGEGADIARYVEALVRMHNTDTSLAKEIADNLRPDVYQVTVTYLVSLFTEDGHILFMIFGMIFAYFYSGNMWYVLRQLPEQTPKLLNVLIATMFVICPIWTVSGVRMWTALHVFAFGALPYLMEGKKKGIIWPLITPLIHFSYLPLAVIFGVFVLLPNMFKSNGLLIRVMAVLYFVTLFVNILDVDAINIYLSQLLPEELYEENVEGYMSEEYVIGTNEFADTKSLLYKTDQFINKFFTAVFMLVCLLALRRTEKNKYRNRLFVFALLMASIGNVLSIVPSGSRYVIIAYMFVYACIVPMFAYTDILNRYKIVRILCYIMILHVAFAFRTALEAYEINLLTGNFFTWRLMETNVPLIHYLYFLVR